MERDYLTSEGKAGRGQGQNRRPRTAVQYIHDVLLRAAEEKLDVYILAGSLSKPLRDDYYLQVTSESFADSLERVLIAGGDIRAIVWNEYSNDLISPQTRWLQKKLKYKSYPGALRILCSNTQEHADEIPHFMIARNKEEENERWIARVEATHPPHSIDEEVTDESPETPALIEFDTEAAKKLAGQLFDAFLSFEQIIIERDVE